MPEYELHPLATQLSLALFARSHYPDYDELIQETIDKLCAHMPDERKADLYAMIEEGTDATMKLGQLATKLSELLYKNAQHYGVQE